jgi:uncharacterized protein YlxP (DUF503 family)
VSIAEVGGLDTYRQATLAVAMVSNDRQHVQRVLSKIRDAAATHRDMVLVEATTEWL